MAAVSANCSRSKKLKRDMTEPVITIEDDPPEKDIRVLWDGIGEYNLSHTGLKGHAVLVFLRDDQHEVMGGAYGWAVYARLHIRVLWLREDQRQRGWGTRILQATEAEAVKKGCRHSHLETYRFQALGYLLNWETWRKIIGCISWRRNSVNLTKSPSKRLESNQR